MECPGHPALDGAVSVDDTTALLDTIRGIWRGSRTRPRRPVPVAVAGFVFADDGTQRPLGELLDLVAPAVAASDLTAGQRTLLDGFYGLTRHPLPLDSGPGALVGRIPSRTSRPMGRSRIAALRRDAVAELARHLTARAGPEQAADAEAAFSSALWWTSSPIATQRRQVDWSRRVGAAALELCAPAEDDDVVEAIRRWWRRHDDRSPGPRHARRLRTDARRRARAALGVAAWRNRNRPGPPADADVAFAAAADHAVFPAAPVLVAVTGYTGQFCVHAAAGDLSATDLDAAAEIVFHGDESGALSDLLAYVVGTVDRTEVDREAFWTYCLIRSFAARGDYRAVGLAHRLVRLHPDRSSTARALSWAAHAASTNADYWTATQLLDLGDRVEQRAAASGTDPTGVIAVQHAWRSALLRAGVQQRRAIDEVSHGRYQDARRACAAGLRSIARARNAFSMLGDVWRDSAGGDFTREIAIGPSDLAATLVRAVEIGAVAAVADGLASPSRPNRAAVERFVIGALDRADAAVTPYIGVEGDVDRYSVPRLARARVLADAVTVGDVDNLVEITADL